MKTKILNTGKLFSNLQRYSDDYMLRTVLGALNVQVRSSHVNSFGK